MYPPGECAFGPDWSTAKLTERRQITHDVILLTFELPDASKPLGLSTCACILAKAVDADNQEIVRPYTPVSTNDLLGKFQLVVKVYPLGKMSTHLNELSLGERVEFKHIEKNVKLQYPFKKKHVTMLIGGTGICPMIQALHAILGTPGDTTNITLLFGNKTAKDILCKDLLDGWSKLYSSRLKVVHVLSDASNDASWTGKKGFINQELIQAEAPPPCADHLVMVCGPPPMYTGLCGPRDKPEEVTGALADLGFSQEHVYKF